MSLPATTAVTNTVTTSHTLSDFDFELPQSLIAQHPAPERSGSRLLDGRTSPPVDRIFRELPNLLSAGDLLVFNDTKVINARLFGDIHDPESVVSRAIAERGGYQLMPEWGTNPANHYLPRRKTEIRIHAEDLERVDNPLKIDGLLPKPAKSEPSLDDVMSW